MFQKEFATKLLEDKLNSINSIINCFFKIRLKFHVSKNCYRPIPKVDSSVLKFEKLNQSLIKTDEIESFIKFKRYLFSYNFFSSSLAMVDFPEPDSPESHIKIGFCLVSFLLSLASTKCL